MIYKDIFLADDNVPDDIALVKFDRPFDFSTWGIDQSIDQKTITDQINPVCLPDSSFSDEEGLNISH